MAHENKTTKKIAELDVLVNPNGLQYVSQGNRILAKSPQGDKMYISSSTAGGDKEMFYAAAGIRNFMTRNGKRPSEDQLARIIERAQASEASREEWAEDYKASRNAKAAKLSQDARKVERGASAPKAKAKHRPGITIVKKAGAPADNPFRSGRGKESFDKAVAKSIDKGIITNMSAASKKKHGVNCAEEASTALGLNMDHRYLSFYNTKKDGYKVRVRITTAKGFQDATILASDFNGDLIKMFHAADSVRRHILKTGKAPTEGRATTIFDQVNTLPGNPITTLPKIQKEQIATSEQTAPKETMIGTDLPRPSEQRPPMKNESGELHQHTTQREQESKSTGTTLLSKVKMWIFG